MNAFIIDGAINSRADLGLRISEPPVFPVSKRVVQSIDVDGREGSLTVLKGWEDVSFTLKAVITGNNINNRWRDILPQIISANTLSFSNDPSVFYKVERVEAGELRRKMTMLAEFSLTFICAPFSYMANATLITLTASGTLVNPGTVFSLPKLKVYGTGWQQVYVNSRLFELNILQDSLFIDSELKECFYGDVAQNNQMRGEFPVFAVGENVVTFGSGIIKIEIEPRWRYL